MDPELIPESVLITWCETAWALCQEELHRRPDAAFVAFYVFHAQQGKPVEVIRGYVRESAEWHQIHDRPPVPAGVQVVGTTFRVKEA